MPLAEDRFAVGGDPVVIVGMALDAPAGSTPLRLRHADRVLFLDAGKIVEDGSVDELLSAGGRFDEFWRQQRDAAEWRIHAG